MQGSSGFHFDEMKFVIFAGNDIYFPMPVSPVSVQYLKTNIFQVFNGKMFACSSNIRTLYQSREFVVFVKMLLLIFADKY